MEYFKYKKANKHVNTVKKSEQPVLTDENKAFLQRIALKGPPPFLPEKLQTFAEAGSTKKDNAQVALINKAQNIPLPNVLNTPEGEVPPLEKKNTSKGKQKATGSKKQM